MEHGMDGLLSQILQQGITRLLVVQQQVKHVEIGLTILRDEWQLQVAGGLDRKSTRLNSSHW